MFQKRFPLRGNRAALDNLLRERESIEEGKWSFLGKSNQSDLLYCAGTREEVRNYVRRHQREIEFGNVQENHKFICACFRNSQGALYWKMREEQQ